MKVEVRVWDGLSSNSFLKCRLKQEGLGGEDRECV